MQDALLPPAARPLRFHEKYTFPKDQKRYHEVNRERATGKSMSSRWTAGSWVGSDSWEAGMIALVAFRKTRIFDTLRFRPSHAVFQIDIQCVS